jgi:hypothetical protein
MRSSRGEIKIAEVLENNNLNFKEEYSFADLVTASGRPLRFDFAVLDDNGDLDFLIEFQGIQHYQSKSKFGGAKGYSKQRYNDNRKMVYCYRNNITLITIPYWDEAKVDYDYIMRSAGY